MPPPKKAEAPKRGPGHPPIVLDYKMVEGFGALHCTDVEMAPLLGISLATLKNRKKTDAAFISAYERGKANGKISLRRSLWNLAIGGNVTAGIWLSKNELGYTDRARVEVGPTGAPDILDADQADALMANLMPGGLPVIDIVPRIESEAQPEEETEGEER